MTYRVIISKSVIGKDPNKRYGILSVNGKNIRAHRYAYMLCHGLREIPKDKEFYIFVMMGFVSVSIVWFSIHTRQTWHRQNVMG